MKQLWIEDFLTLVDAGTFSRAAALRHVTQPAFSRRIQSLEAWLGVDLVDRRSQPMRLTAVALQHVPQFRALLRDFSQLRSGMHAEGNGLMRVVLATQHSLTMTRVPALIQEIQKKDKSTHRIDFRVRSENRDECTALFIRGEADLLLCMEEQEDLLCALMPDASRLSLGHETLVPLSAPTKAGKALHTPRAGQQLKLLAFPPDSFLGRVTYKSSLGTLFQLYNVDVVHESLFLAGIKEMLLAGLGMAWLPESLVERELKSGTLVNLSSSLKTIKLPLGLYRSSHAQSPEAIDRIWSMFGK
ncbi:MAG: LysR family transcriptional regulator [Candidimonas sp.]|nr:MAG: LysR family transcriptional regulator [Candidimonas sp.]TAM23339.1 MAG: LysR family transcriptional regulator [Candidimonas sp.]TAM75738.1 MAG: LysR family transcriptional regulator [Candidimonas sp.]